MILYAVNDCFLCSKRLADDIYLGKVWQLDMNASSQTGPKVTRAC